MPEDSISLIAEAAAVFEQCETFLEAAADSVRAIPKDHIEALECISVTENRKKQAEKELDLVLRDNSDHWHETEAEKIAEAEYFKASEQAQWARNRLGSERLDTEYRKAVARQVAGLLREDSLKELDDIASRSNAPEVQQTIAAYKDEVARATRYIINMFPAATEIQLAEVRKARTEARATLDHFINPPVD